MNCYSGNDNEVKHYSNKTKSYKLKTSYKVKKKVILQLSSRAQPRDLHKSQISINVAIKKINPNDPISIRKISPLRKQKLPPVEMTIGESL